MRIGERGIGIRVRTAGLWNHRGQLRVTQSCQRAGAAEQQKRQHQRGAGADADHFAVGADLAGGSRADRAENAGADHCADREHDQIARAERPLQPVRAVGFRDELRDRFALKQLRHGAAIVSDTES